MCLYTWWPLTHHPLTHATSLCVFVHVVAPNSPPAHPHHQFVCVCTRGGPLTHHPLTHTTSLCVSVHVAAPNSPPAHPHYQFVCVCTRGGPLTHHPLTHTTSLCVSVHVAAPNSPPAHPHYQFVCVCTRGGPLTHHRHHGHCCPWRLYLVTVITATQQPVSSVVASLQALTSTLWNYLMETHSLTDSGLQPVSGDSDQCHVTLTSVRCLYDCCTCLPHVNL